MKRSAMRRGDGPRRFTPLRRVGARKKRERRDERSFQRAVIARAKGRCERCRRRPDLDECLALEAHHIVPRSRAPGWEFLHDPKNGAALCGGPAGCHAAVHDHRAHDWPRWLRDAP